MVGGGGGGGGGGMGDLVWVRIFFFPKPLVIELHTTPLYGRYFLARYFSLEISLQDIFF